MKELPVNAGVKISVKIHNDTPGSFVYRKKG